MKSFLFFIVAFVVGFFSLYLSSAEKPQVKVISPQPVTKMPSFSLANSPSESKVGDLESISGEVFFESRVASIPAVISSPQEIHQGEMVLTHNGTVSVYFKDMSRMVLSKDTTLRIIQTLPFNLVIAQDAGTVIYTKLGIIPFSIRIAHLLLDIDDGEMIVTRDNDAHKIFVNGVTGEVSVAYNNLDLESQVFYLKKGDTLAFDDDKRQAIIQ